MGVVEPVPMEAAAAVAFDVASVAVDVVFVLMADAAARFPISLLADVVDVDAVLVASVMQQSALSLVK